MPFVNVIKIHFLLAIGTENGANASFSVQCNIFPKLKAQILQMRYQNVYEGSGFTTEKKTRLT